MRVVPRPYYQCDYCDRTADMPNFAYSDNSGLDNKTYDLCSDECRDRHTEYLFSKFPREEAMEHIRRWL